MPITVTGPVLANVLELSVVSNVAIKLTLLQVYYSYVCRNEVGCYRSGPALVLQYVLCDLKVQHHTYVAESCVRPHPLLFIRIMGSRQSLHRLMPSQLVHHFPSPTVCC